jgi:hypothetical protein
LPFFSYINFVLGYIPLALSDTTSQIIILTYILYSSFVYYLQFFLNKSFSNSINISSFKDSTKSTLKTPLTEYRIKDSLSSLFKLRTSYNYTKKDYPVPFFSKKLNILSKDIHLLNNFKNPSSSGYTSNFTTPYSQLNLKTLKLKNKYFNLKSELVRSQTNITTTEALYLNLDSNLFQKTKNTQLTLNDLYKISKLNKYPSLFSFNIENNLNMAKQQR